MRVGFGCTVLANGLQHGGVDGIGSYTRELGGRLEGHESISLLPLSFGVPAIANFPLARTPVRVMSRYAPMATVSAICPFAFPTMGIGMDVFHATDHLIPRFSGIPVVATLMDAIPLSHPEWVRMRLAGLKRWLWRRASRWADHVITISDYSKREIATHFDINPEKISVVPLGVDERYFERFDSHEKQDVIQRLDLPEQFFLFVGTLQPRKNIGRVLDAHAALSSRLRKNVPLVVVGRNGWGCESLVARLRDEASHRFVFWLDYLPDRELRVLMQMAQALVFPSLCEGFGLPVAEGFASGLPVITSNTTALPEVAKDAALLVNPLNVGEISDAMRQVVEVSGLNERLVNAGLCRAHELSWAACAEKTLNIYQRVLR